VDRGRNERQRELSAFSEKIPDLNLSETGKIRDVPSGSAFLQIPWKIVYL
jgi:hypothetical protein